MSRRPEAAHLPAPIPGETARRVPNAEAAFAAQLAGQGGQRRGLRGGPPVLTAARTTYLRTEWSGPCDRRPAVGAVIKARA